MTSQDIRCQIRETRQEMRAKGIRRIACFNGGLLGEVYSLNARMFRLETALQDAIKAERKVIYTAEHYDYDRQAWVSADGRYLCCAHPREMNCNCYGRLHYGELAHPTEHESEAEQARRGR